MSRENRARRTRRFLAALALIASWSLGGVWAVSHAVVHTFEHAGSDHKAELGEDHHAEGVALSDDGHGHEHPDEGSVLSTVSPRYEMAAALVGSSLPLSADERAASLHCDWEVSARGSPGATGPSGPRAPPLS